MHTKRIKQLVRKAFLWQHTKYQVAYKLRNNIRSVSRQSASHITLTAHSKRTVLAQERDMQRASRHSFMQQISVQSFYRGMKMLVSATLKRKMLVTLPCRNEGMFCQNCMVWRDGRNEVFAYSQQRVSDLPNQNYVSQFEILDL